MRTNNMTEDDVAVAAWILGLALIVGAIILVVVLVFVGLCAASLFLPVIIALAGVVMIWKGSKGNPQVMVIGLVLLIVGVVVWLWS